MKKAKLFAAALLLTVCNSVFAQYDDYYYDSYHTTTVRSTSYDFEEGLGNIHLTYSPLQLTTDYKGVDNLNFNAFTLGYSYTMALGGPACLEFGFDTTGAYYSEKYNDDGKGVKHTYEFYYSKVPISLALFLSPNENFAFIPYAGFHGKVNISGKETYEDSYGTERIDLFDKDDIGNDHFKRFQLGYQAGFKFLFFSALSIGASYEGDLTPVYSDHVETQKFRGFHFTLGYNF